MRSRAFFRACLLGAAAVVAASVGSGRAAERWSRDGDGRVTIRPLSVDKELQNEWPKEWEREFADRSNYVIREKASAGRYGNTFFENEKRAYGWAMLSLLGGFDEPALKFLQERDNLADRWNRNTLGIDYYPCFTLKHQMRKYFFFGDSLDAKYREQMKKAAKIFTEKDPLRRPHYAHDPKVKAGWGPDRWNSWVDIRSTDNLKLMRDTSVYLLAEEAGNEEMRKLYKKRLTDFIVTLYHQGQGEFDSENYLGHSVAPLLNLYDFAKDREVQALAKAGLDWMTTCAALKYYRGAYNGPSRRDYNHPYPFGGSAAALTWMWFGDSPKPNTHFESDEIQVITSAYRPPQAVVHLARKNFARPAELIAGKPKWECWKTPDTAKPTYRETHYFGKTFQFGTLMRGTQDPDINGFKIVTYSKDRGADTIIAGPVNDPLKLGSSMYKSGIVAPNSAVGQNGNMAIYLTQESDHPYLFLVPESAKIESHRGVTFVLCEKTTLAIWPINLGDPKLDKKLTETVQVKEKKGRDGKVTREPRWTGSKILRADRRGHGVYGFAVEIDEGKASDFMAKALKIRPETDEVAERGAAAMTAVGGRRVRLQWGNTPDAIKIWRDGKLRDFASDAENVMFRTLSKEPLVDQAWQGNGTLKVHAGGKSFTSTVTRGGNASFEEE